MYHRCKLIVAYISVNDISYFIKARHNLSDLFLVRNLVVNVYWLNS